VAESNGSSHSSYTPRLEGGTNEPKHMVVPENHAVPIKENWSRWETMFCEVFRCYSDGNATADAITGSQSLLPHQCSRGDTSGSKVLQLQHQSSPNWVPMVDYPTSNYS